MNRIAAGFASSAAFFGIVLSAIAMAAGGRLPSDAEGSWVAAVAFEVVAFGVLAICGGAAMWLVLLLFRRWLMAISPAGGFALGAALGLVAIVSAGTGLFRYLQFAHSIAAEAMLAGVIAALLAVAISALLQRRLHHFRS